MTDEEMLIKWRDILRSQLTNAASLFFAFSSATIAFVISKLLDGDLKSIGVNSGFVHLAACLRPLYISILIYSIFMLSRLYDFWRTQRGLSQGKQPEMVRTQTYWIGTTTWVLFFLQLSFLCWGLWIFRLAFIVILYGH